MVSTRTLPAAGPTFTLTAGAAEVQVASLAAALRSYRVGDVQLTETWADGQIPPGAAGILLAPWTNRIDGGLWRLDGAEQQLDLTEVPKVNAIHGLLRNTGYHPIRQTPGSLTLSADIYPQHGYPFHLVHTATYELSADQLTVTQSLTNHSSRSAPFALGAHPYLKISGVPTSELRLTVRAECTFPTNARSIPVGTAAVNGSTDFRHGRRIGSTGLDAAFGGLTLRNGKHEHTLSAPDGRSVTLWTDESLAYVHVFLSTSYPGVDMAVAIEPMTAPANAFNSGEGLRWLPAGETFSAQWGIAPALG